MRRRGWVPGRAGTEPAQGLGRAAQWRISVLRRTAAVLAAGLAVWWIVDASLAVGAPAQHQVIVAARDLATGTVLGSSDLHAMPWSGNNVPDALLSSPDEPVGQVLNGPLRAGEPLTRTRLGAGSLLQGLPQGSVMVQLTSASATGVSLARAGDRVDVLSTADGAVIATDLQVLAITGGNAGESALGSGVGAGDDAGAQAVILASGPVTAQRLARATGSSLGGPNLVLTVRASKGN